VERIALTLEQNSPQFVIENCNKCAPIPTKYPSLPHQAFCRRQRVESPGAALQRPSRQSRALSYSLANPEHGLSRDFITEGSNFPAVLFSLASPANHCLRAPWLTGGLRGALTAPPIIGTECHRQRLRATLLASSSACLSEATCLRQRRTLCRIVWRRHGIVVRKSPLGPVFGGRHAVLCQ
jgi:hypothetical protein